MKYKIKVGNKYLIGESAKETLKGTIRGDTTAVYSRFVGEMSAYDFCDSIVEAEAFDRVTACDYVRGLMERQNSGLYPGEIKLIDADAKEGVWQIEKDALWLGGGKTVCSACGFGYAHGAYHEVTEFNFCPNCGAKMDGEDGNA